MTKSHTLHANETWKEVCRIAGRMYELSDAIEEKFPDEKWLTAAKLRSAANDAAFYVAQALSGEELVVNEYEWSSAKKYLYGMQAMYIFAGKQKLTQIDPDIIVSMDALLLTIENNLEIGKVLADKKRKEELEPWLEKYALWQKMQK